MNYLEKNKENFIKDLRGLIKIKSFLRDPNIYPTKEMKDAVEYMISLAKKENFKSYSDSEGYYGWIEVGQGKEMIGILGHLDVVPPGEEIDKWDHPPFDLTIKNDLLLGRGTQDDKGPVILSFYLLKSIVEQKTNLNKRIRLIFPTDEESFWRGIEKYKSDGQEIPEYGFTPDSTFPLIYSERELWEFKIKGETTSDFEIKSGMALNVVPDKAIYTKDNNEISFEGKAAHAMHPWKGDNAIYKLLQNIDEKHELISFIKNEINFETNGKTLFGKLIKDENEQLSLNLALLKINENESQLGIDIRIPSTTNSLELETKIKKILKEKYPKLKFEHYDQLPGVNVSLESNWAKSMISSYQEITGDLETMPIATGGATYARSMDNIVAFGPFFNSSPNTEHQYNEHIKFEDLKKSFDIYELLIKKIL